MSDLAFLIICLAFTALGYGIARAADAARRMDEREHERQRRQQAFRAQRRPAFHPTELANIQDRAELDDLRDYIRRGDA